MAIIRQSTGTPKLDAALIANLQGVPRVLPVISPIDATGGRFDITSTNEFTLSHGLGEAPDFFLYNPWSDIRIYANEASRAKWDQYTIALQSSGTGTAQIFVGKL